MRSPLPRETSAKIPGLLLRPATAADAGTLLGLIRELAEFEKLAHEVVATEADLQATLFGDQPTAEVCIAELNGQIAGSALFFHNYSTFLGRPGIYVEDVYVKPSHRGKGIGEAFFRYLARVALARNCGRMDWSVLDWNEHAIRFYRRLGAVPMEGWTVQRLTGATLKSVADSG